MSGPTPSEFEAAYAERSGVSVAALHEWGRRVAPCDCGEEECEGWQMAHVSGADDAARAIAAWRRWADENLRDRPPRAAVR